VIRVSAETSDPSSPSAETGAETWCSARSDLSGETSETSRNVQTSVVDEADQGPPPDPSRNGHRKQREVWYYPQRE
jgi:hypothetical protein